MAVIVPEHRGLPHHVLAGCRPLAAAWHADADIPRTPLTRDIARRPKYTRRSHDLHIFGDQVILLLRLQLRFVIAVTVTT
jgi:hypothetical protein